MKTAVKKMNMGGRVMPAQAAAGQARRPAMPSQANAGGAMRGQARAAAVGGLGMKKGGVVKKPAGKK